MQASARICMYTTVLLHKLLVHASQEQIPKYVDSKSHLPLKASEGQAPKYVDPKSHLFLIALSIVHASCDDS